MHDDHAPIGSVAFRTEPHELMASSRALQEEAKLADSDLVPGLLGTADYYEDLAYTMVEIRSLPEAYPVNT